MPGGARLDAEGALRHVMVRGLERRKIFLTSADRDDFIRRLAAVVPEAEARIFAWSLLPNHTHVLMRKRNYRNYIPFYKEEICFEKENHEKTG